MTIPTCAIWNATGNTVAGNYDGSTGKDLASLDSPVNIFVDNNFTLYVADRDNSRVLKYPANVTVGTVVAGNDTQGNTASLLKLPRGVAVDQMGAVIVGDSGNYRIQKFDIGSTVGVTLAANAAWNPLGDTRDLHIDVNNNVYVTDSDYSRIVKFYPGNGIGEILAGASAPGNKSYQLLTPFGNYMDTDGTLYIADSGNHRVQKWLNGASNGTTVAGITGVKGAALTRLTNPRGVIVDNNK